MAKFGSARNGENGARNNQAGDQTGREVMIQDAYMHRNGWTIIRAKNPDVANALAFSMACACSNDEVGYDQNDRYSIFFTGITNHIPTECDCSSLVAWCCVNCGITNFEVNGFYTGNEVQRLSETDAFDVLPCNSISDMYTGDILVDSAGTSHTGIVVEGKSRDMNTFDVAQPILRRGSKGWEVVKWQTFLNFFCGQNLKPDGDFGAKTEESTLNFQRWFNASNSDILVDGIYGNQCLFISCCILAQYGLQPC